MFRHLALAVAAVVAEPKRCTISVSWFRGQTRPRRHRNHVSRVMRRDASSSPSTTRRPSRSPQSSTSRQVDMVLTWIRRCAPALVIVSIGACSAPSAPTQTQPFAVVQISVVGAASYAGACPVTLHFPLTLKLHLPQAGTYTYAYLWERSDGSKSSPMTGAPSLTGSAAVFPVDMNVSETPYTLTISDTSTGWVKAVAVEPNNIASAQASFSVTCTGNPQGG